MEREEREEKRRRREARPHPHKKRKMEFFRPILFMSHAAASTPEMTREKE